jgi:ribonuclease Z
MFFKFLGIAMFLIRILIRVNLIYVLTKVSGLEGCDILIANPLLKVSFIPEFKIDESEVINGPQEKSEDNEEEYMQNLEIFRREIGDFGDSVDSKSLNVIPLGTGSSAPGKYRNVSSTLIQLSLGNVLLDCGEGTLGQLFRVFGPLLTEELRKIKVIFISHLHADHHLGISILIYSPGTIGVLKRIYELDPAVQSRIIIIAPSTFLSFLEEYSKIEDFGFDQLICRDSFNLKSAPTKINEDIESILETAQTIRVTHCPNAYAVVLNLRDERQVYKISYSGDCRPSPNFAEIGTNSDLLIHEATFDDDMKDEAIAKKHSTIGEALEIGQL